MTIIVSDSVSSVSDIVIKYVNHLLMQHAMDQNLLANRMLDEKIVQQRDDVRAKNTELEAENRRLREYNATLINESSGSANTTMGVVQAMNIHAQGRSIDGDLAIKAGRDALDRHVNGTRQPERGD